MVLPRLNHPIPTQIQSFLPNDTLQDDGYEAPVQRVEYGDTFTINGQWFWEGAQSIKQFGLGTEESYNGYVVLRVIDLNLLGKSIKRGDRICGYGVGIGHIDLDVYIVKIQYMGHYPDQGGPSLIKAFFLDRQPSRQTGGE